MTPATPTPGRIRRALDVILTLPPEALADLAEHIVDRLDASDPDPEREPDVDDRALLPRVRARFTGPGDQEDAEEGDPPEEGAEAEPDGETCPELAGLASWRLGARPVTMGADHG